jgi:hypothetical protein
MRSARAFVVTRIERGTSPLLRPYGITFTPQMSLAYSAMARSEEK